MAHLDLYYLAFPEDRTFNKALVYGVFILETLQSILLLTGNTYMTYALLPSHHDLPALSHLGLQVNQVSVFQYHTIFNMLWVAIPLLGGLGMVSQIKSSFNDSCLC